MIPRGKKAGQGRSWIQYKSTSPSTPLGHQFRSNQKKIKSQINTNYVTPRFQLAAHCEHSEYHTNANQTTTISIINSCHSPPSYYMVVKLIVTHHTAKPDTNFVQAARMGYNSPTTDYPSLPFLTYFDGAEMCQLSRSKKRLCLLMCNLLLVYSSQSLEIQWPSTAVLLVGSGSWQ
jgi:hypothetical protein